MEMAPAMSPKASIEPAHTVEGISNSTEAIYSSTPTPILPHGSIPIVVKI